ncbi:MAG: hypothetical protein WBB28_10720 [Crinalium sp.]
MSIFIDCIPADKLSPEQFFLLCHAGMPYKLKGTIGTPPENLIASINIDWGLCIHWMYKEQWNRKHKLPYMKKPKSEGLKVQSEPWLHLLRICWQLYGMGGKNESDSGLRRWTAIFLEHRLNELLTLYEPTIVEKLPRKSEVRSAARAKLNKLRMADGAENPYCEKRSPFLYRLIEDATSKANDKVNNESNHSFSRDFWNPFIKSLRREIDNIQHEGLSIAGFVDNQWMTRSNISDKTTIPIKSSPESSMLNARTLTPQSFHDLVSGISKGSDLRLLSY